MVRLRRSQEVKGQVILSESYLPPLPGRTMASLENLTDRWMASALPKNFGFWSLGEYNHHLSRFRKKTCQLTRFAKLRTG